MSIRYPWNNGQIQIRPCGMREAITRVYFSRPINIRIAYRKLKKTRIDSYAVATRMFIEDSESFFKLVEVIGLHRNEETKSGRLGPIKYSAA